MSRSTLIDKIESKNEGGVRQVLAKIKNAYESKEVLREKEEERAYDSVEKVKFLFRPANLFDHDSD